ncbi:unnamed protein product [Microthlaspi erraticum]|uniref:WW domain-containing protein n=1 Tax=Microthlaspi erraticum TaxID=1685480 RepID=A0A6D2KXQ3_9BRAS|nr:unnamed protein product [Microthlaspi erraticum]
MEGFATKVSESNDCDAAQIRKSSSSTVSRMYVEGYDTSLCGYDLFVAMKEQFGSCGKVLHVYIPGYARNSILNRFALIYLRGEDAEEKASKLNGSCMGGHTLVVEPYPFHADHLDHKFAPTRDADNEQSHLVSIEGYDTALPLDYVKSTLCNVLSRYTPLPVRRVMICELEKGVLCRAALVTVYGINVIERLLHLRGVIGMEDIELAGVSPPDPERGCTIDIRPKLPETSPPRTWVPHADPGLPKPPCLSHLLPHPWESGGGFFWNPETGVKFEIPASASTSRYAPEDLDPTLPKPWKGLVDNSSGYVYFWNTETGVTQWKRPSSETNVT